MVRRKRPLVVYASAGVGVHQPGDRHLVQRGCASRYATYIYIYILKTHDFIIYLFWYELGCASRHCRRKRNDTFSKWVHAPRCVFEVFLKNRCASRYATYIYIKNAWFCNLIILVCIGVCIPKLCLKTDTSGNNWRSSCTQVLAARHIYYKRMV